MQLLTRHPIFYIESSYLDLIDLDKVHTARVYDVPESESVFDSTIIAFCDKDGEYLHRDENTNFLVTGELVTDSKLIKSFSENILSMAFHNKILLNNVKLERIHETYDYWKVTVGDLLI